MLINKIFKRIPILLFRYINNIRFVFIGVDYKKINYNGLTPPYLNISKKGIFKLNGKMNTVNTFGASTLGVNRRCKITVYNNALLEINGVMSMSNTVIVCTKHISIGNNVMIGGGVTIVDSDFHSMDSSNWCTPNDELLMKRSDVIIGNNVFIGMYSIILKGVNIGNNVIIAAGSVVSKSIPDGEVWGGNPAKFISKTTNNKE